MLNRRYTSTTSPSLLKKRTFFPSSRILMPTRSAFLLRGLNSARLDRSMGASFSMMPPVSPLFGLGLTCFLTMFTSLTSARPLASTLSTVPRLPLSRPARTTTSSPFLILFIMLLPSQNFRRQRDDPHELLGAKFAGHGAEDAGPDGLELVVEQHRGILVEPDQRSV